MHHAVPSPYLVPFDGKFRLRSAPTAPPSDAPDKPECEARLAVRLAEIDEWQRKLYADDRFALLLIFQAMDAAGKDSTIRAVMRGVDPSGCQVYAFKPPSAEELDHDFLWRTARCLPERGRIGVFNRSYYEEVLTVRVHPELLAAQKLPEPITLPRLWKHRLASIRSHEKHLARSGIVVLKFWLNVSRDEQKKRFLSRIDEPEKNWKFAEGDVRERACWDAYMHAYKAALRATSRSWAPWYAIPADSKHYMRMCVAEIIAKTLESLAPKYPTIPAERRRELLKMRRALERE